MALSLVAGVGVAAIALLLVSRLIRSEFLRGIRWTLALVAVVALLDVATGVAVPDSRWGEVTTIGLVIALGLLAARVFVALVIEWLLVQRAGVVVPRLARDLLALFLYVTVAALTLRYAAGVQLSVGLPAAAATVLVGFAMQETLGTLLSGLVLAWERRVEAGVWVDIGGVEGAVEELGWRSLVLRTNLDERIVVPNSQAARERLRVLGTGDPPVAYGITVHAAYSFAPHAVKSMLREVCRDIPYVVAQPPPRVLVRKFDENGIRYECRVWTNEPRRHNEIEDAVLTRAFAVLRREGVEIPLPQRVVRRAERHAEVDRVELSRGALAGCELFGGLPEDALDVLARASRWLEFAPAEAVVREGDASRALYVVGAGEAAVVHAGVEVALIGEGEVFGEMAFLTGQARSATVKAKGSLSVVEVDTRALRTLLTEHAEVAEELAGRMAARRAELAAHDDAARAPRERKGLAAFLLEQFQKLVAG